MIIHKSSSNSNSSSIITNMTYQRINLHQITCLFLVLVVTLHHHVTYTYSKPCRTDWSDLDLHQLDYEWNQNDDDDDDDDDKIKTPDQEFFEINEAHRQKAQSLLKQHAQGDIHLNSNRLIELQHAGTPAMIFAHLRKTSTTKSKSKSKSKWTWDELSEICQEWGVSTVCSVQCAVSSQWLYFVLVTCPSFQNNHVLN